MALLLQPAVLLFQKNCFKKKVKLYNIFIYLIYSIHALGSYLMKRDIIHAGRCTLLFNSVSNKNKFSEIN